jgi:hypothetical protein
MKETSITIVKLFCLYGFFLQFFACSSGTKINSEEFFQAQINGQLANEGFNRCIKYVNAWTLHADSSTGLIPRNIRESKDIWNAWDAAADNYPFMVFTASILMPDFYANEAVNILKTEQELSSRIGRLPDTYSFSKHGFQHKKIDTSQIIFGSAEYMKDGLIPLTEWLGQSPWSDRMLGILDDLPLVVRRADKIKGDWLGNSADVEVNGDLMQVLARMYWFTGKKEYLDRAVEIAGYYLNDEHLPTKALDYLRIRDHGCEIISGLCEVYLASFYANPEKHAEWKPYIHSMLDRILEIGRNADGLFYDGVNPKTGEVIENRAADTYGYTLNACYFVSIIDSVPAYRDAVIKALGSLNEKYRNYDWENGSADGYADAIESALNLYNREPIVSVGQWLDSEIKVLWQKQQADGMVEGWHGDGNFARTTIMYSLWKTQGIVASPWDSTLDIGAVEKGGRLMVALGCSNDWQGILKFDAPRYRNLLHYPFDYPRINQFQQWFTIDPKSEYTINYPEKRKKVNIAGKELIDGFPLKIKKGDHLFIEVAENNKNE